MPRINQNLNKAEAAALRAIAQGHGYTATRGPLVKGGQESGNATELLLAIISGEVATVLLDSDERWRVIEALERHAGTLDGWLGESIISVANQLRAAAERERQLDTDEIREYLIERASAPPHPTDE